MFVIIYVNKLAFFVVSIIALLLLQIVSYLKIQAFVTDYKFIVI